MYSFAVQIQSGAIQIIIAIIMILLRWVRSSTIKTTDKGNWRLNRNVRQILLACSKGEDSYMFIILCVRRFCCIEFFDVMALQELAIKLKRNDENFKFSSVRKYRTHEHPVSLYLSIPPLSCMMMEAFGKPTLTSSHALQRGLSNSA